MSYEFVPESSLKFSGHDWYIKAANHQMGPENNWFSSNQNNIFVDQNGHLNMRIVKQGNKWLCSEVAHKKGLGFGTYIFCVKNGYQNFDKNTVLGLFTYEDTKHEIDFEIAKWGDQNNANTQFVVQPYNIPGNIKRFNCDGRSVVLAYTWAPEYILFQAFYAQSVNQVISQIGKQSHSQKKISQWSYKGHSNPKPNIQRARINLWLIKPPSNGQQQLAVIKQFRFLNLDHNEYHEPQNQDNIHPNVQNPPQNHNEEGNIVQNIEKQYVDHHSRYSLVGVYGKCGQFIDSIAFKYVNIDKGTFHENGPYGGQGGYYFSWDVPKGEWVTHIYFRSGDFLDSIQFRTNKGNKSAKFGGNGGNYRQLNITGRRIAGTKIKAARYINNIDFLLEPPS